MPSVAKQAATRRVKIATIMRRASFVRGFKEGQRGTPMDYEAYRERLSERWSYERGRILGMLYQGSLKEGQRVTTEAIRAYKIAAACGDII